MAAYALRATAEGACARPGGAGKSALLGGILGLMPPEVRIVSVDSSDVTQRGLRRRRREVELEEARRRVARFYEGGK